MKSPKIAELVRRQRAYFDTHATRDVGFRIDALVRLRDLLKKNETPLLDAVYADLKKSRFEAMTTELSLVYGELNQAIRDLPRWAGPLRVRKNLLNFPERSYLLPEPFGVTYVAGAWNYPLQLSLLPMVSAIAAGNTVIVKPSELAPATARAMAETINAAFPPEYIRFVEGGPALAGKILEERFDKIFFTGGTAIGRKVYAAAAKNLTPVTLELGGKNPAIVLPDANIPVAARRIAWGKFLNAGQTCIAPDFILVHASVEKRLLAELQKVLEEDFKHTSTGDGYTAIVNRRHFERLVKFLRSGQIAHGGKTDKRALFISPTVLRGVGFDDGIMQEEIFGPILPVVRYEHLPEALEKIRPFGKPLSFYLFGKRSAVTDRLFREVSFGGGSLNDTVLYFGNRRLPHGGVGTSGMGGYHGEFGFREFSHYKAVLEKGTWFELWSLKTPPYTDRKLRVLRWLIE